MLDHRSSLLVLTHEAPDEHTDIWTARLHIAWSQESLHQEVRCQIMGALGQARHQLPELAFPDGDEDEQSVTFFPNSVMGELHGLADELVDACPWEHSQAVWFALTGAIPVIFPFRSRLQHILSRYHSHNALTLNVDPRMTPAALMRAYASIRRQHLGRQRQPGDKALAMFDFVVGRMDPFGGIADWDALVEEWNKAKGSLRTYEHAWRFRRDFNRALRLIAYSKEPSSRQAGQEDDS